MYESLCFLAATLATGVPGDVPPGAAYAANSPAYEQTASPQPSTQQAGGRPGLLDRLGAWLHSRPAKCSSCATANRPGPTAAQPQPAPDLQTVGGIASADEGVPAVARPNLELTKEVQNKVGHAEDYGWVTGQLFYVHAGGEGLWVLRYAGVDEEDRYGGSVVLSTAVSMRNFREGDLVSATGELLKEGRASKYLGGPLYRATSVNMVERSDP